MIDLISAHRQSIEHLCRTHGIRRLDLFGSAATGTFDPATSDIDFIVDLGGYEPGVARRFLRFADAFGSTARTQGRPDYGRANPEPVLSFLR